MEDMDLYMLCAAQSHMAVVSAIYGVEGDQAYLERCTPNALRELRDGLFMQHHEGLHDANLYTGMVREAVDAELAHRRQRLADGPSFRPRDRVCVCEDLRWWPESMALKPRPGVIGVVRSWRGEPREWTPAGSDPDYYGLVRVRFLAVDLGYPWEPGDDLDRKYVTYNMPNYSLELR